jgi:hypothetical protein
MRQRLVAIGRETEMRNDHDFDLEEILRSRVREMQARLAREPDNAVLAHHLQIALTDLRRSR